MINYIKESKSNRFDFTLIGVQKRFQREENRGNYAPGCEYLKDLLTGYKVTMSSVYTFNRRHSNLKDKEIYVMDVIRELYNNYTFIDDRGDKYEPNFQRAIYCVLDEEEYERKRNESENFFKERERKKEELKNKMKDIDPYGEEDWEDDLNESSKPKYFDLNNILNKYSGNLAMIEQAIEDLVIGETCIWYMNNNRMKREVVSSVEVGKRNVVYFNGFTVNTEFSIEIEKSEKEESYIIGSPSGEVIYLNNEQIEKLIKEKLLSKVALYKGGSITYSYKFMDVNYHKIKMCLDPSYKKPLKNIETNSVYKIGDIVICQGASDMMDVQDQIGKVLNVASDSRNEIEYLVEFVFHFNKMLHDGKNGPGNCWWVKFKNIRGLYTGDIDTHRLLSRLSDDRLEEHEIDDDYHIRNLFKNKK